MVIARAGIRSMVSKKAFLGLMLVSWFPFFVRAVQFYAAANLTSIPQASMLSPSADTFRQFLEQQRTFVFFVTVYVGAGLIANDRRANALQIYLSKPLTRAEYVFGKLAILMTFLALVTWLPAIVLLIVQIAFAGNFTFFRTNVFLFPAITLFAFIEIAGKRKTLAVKKAKLPAKAIWTISSTIAGSQVTSARKVIRIASLPNTYSARVSGFDR